MKFIPTPPEQPTTVIKQDFYWQPGGQGKELFNLYHQDRKVASLLLYGEEDKSPLIKIDCETYEFLDKSSFFRSRLLILEKENKSCAGQIEKNSSNPVEGTIKLQGQVYGWKFQTRPDSCLLVMDQHRSRLFSYHYGPGYIRLLLNKSGRNESQVISLLCIGLYLLPVWQRSFTRVMTG